MKTKNLPGIIIILMLCIAVLCSCAAGDTDFESITLTDSMIGEVDGYSYELWKDSGNTTMTVDKDGTFTCEWSNINNCLFRRGMKFDCTQTYREIGNIQLEYKADYNPDGNSYLCLYGWTREPLVEYYIVDSWGSWRPPGGAPIGTVEIDGGVYDVYRTLRVNQPSIDGNTTFEQYWSVRQEKRTEGTINASSHFAAWESMGMHMGKMYEAALTVEGYQSAGSAEILKNEFTLGGEISEAKLPEPLTPEEPDSDGYYFHSTFESGSDGWGVRGDSAVSSSSKAAFSGEKSLSVTGRKDAWQGTGRDLNLYTFIPGNIYGFSAMVMQDVKDTETFKLTLQYNTSSGTNYDCIAECTAAKGEWAALVNGSYTIPENSWGLLLYVETSEGTADFYIDEATAGLEGTVPEAALSMAEPTEETPQDNAE